MKLNFDVLLGLGDY